MADNKNNVGISGKPEIAGEDDQTVKFSKKEVKASEPRVSLGATADGKNVKPSDETTISPAGAIDPATGKNKGRKTIKLQPLTGDVANDDSAEETISMSREILEEETVAVPPLSPASLKDGKGNLEDESTVKIQKPKMSKPAHPIPDITAPTPGESKQTVKLRPPSSEKDKAKPAPAAASKKTIKLSPQSNSNGKSESAAPKPSAPTVKMPEPKAQSTTASKKSFKIKQQEPPQAPPTTTQSAPPQGGKSTTSARAVVSSDDKMSNPGPMLTIAAVLATLCMIYYVWAVVGQWAEQYQEAEDSKVPGLSGAVLPPQ